MQVDMSEFARNQRRKKFTTEEDTRLCEVVDQYGAKNWNKIALLIPGRTGRQCRDRYLNYLKPGYFSGEWSQEEDQLLIKQYKIFGSHWSKIAQSFNGRSANALKNRWNYFVCRLPESEPSSPIPMPIIVKKEIPLNDELDIQQEIDTYDFSFPPQEEFSFFDHVHDNFDIMNEFPETAEDFLL